MLDIIVLLVFFAAPGQTAGQSFFLFFFFFFFFFFFPGQEPASASDFDPIRLRSSTPFKYIMMFNARTVSFCGQHSLCIAQTRLYNVDLLKPHCYIVKLGFTGVYIFVLISAPKHRL